MIMTTSSGLIFSIEKVNQPILLTIDINFDIDSLSRFSCVSKYSLTDLFIIEVTFDTSPGT